MSRFSLWTYFSPFCVVLLITVQAESPPAMTEADPIPEPFISSTSVADNNQCECQMFIQSWKTSNMIRLPLGMEPIQLNSTAEGDVCLTLCQQRLPSQSEIGGDWWKRLYRRACRTLLINDHQIRLKQESRMKNELTAKNSASGAVRGCLQAYARSSNTHIWVPMGLEFRKVLSCTHPPRNRRSLRNNGQNKQNSIDAQSVINSNNFPDTDNDRPPQTLAESTKQPLLFNLSPVRTVLKQLGFFSPYIDNFIRMLDRMNVRDVLERVNLGGYVDRYQKLYNDYTEELDVGHCFLEYAVYTIFNHRFALKNALASVTTNRGFQQDAMGMALDMASEFLQRDNASQILTSLFKMIPSSIRQPSSNSIQTDDASDGAPEPVPDVQALATNIARFYLRNYFSNLPGSTVRVDQSDPTNNPESLADMVEQVSRPVFLSVFGVVPGVPASGRLDHLLLIASKERPTEQKSPFGTESRNKLQPLDQPLRTGSSRPTLAVHHHPPKTGNKFFDIGNSFFSTIQRANDATHGLYCAKQYAVNKMWDMFRGAMRRMMRAIPSAG